MFEYNLRKKQGEDATDDIINLIETKLNGESVFMDLIEDATPVKGVSDDGKPYMLLTSDVAAIVAIRKDKNNLTVVFIRPNNGLAEIDSILKSKYQIFAFRGRTSPFEREIKMHILEMISEGEEEFDNESEKTEEKENAEQPEKKEKPQRKDKRDDKEVEPNESSEITDEIVRMPPGYSDEE